MRHIDNADWRSLFQDNRLGREVLENLTGLFYDRPSFDPDNTHKTSYNEGQRSVIEYILRKCALVPEAQPDDEDTE